MWVSVCPASHWLTHLYVSVPLCFAHTNSCIWVSICVLLTLTHLYVSVCLSVLPHMKVVSCSHQLTSMWVPICPAQCEGSVWFTLTSPLCECPSVLPHTNSPLCECPSVLPHTNSPLCECPSVLPHTNSPLCECLSVLPHTNSPLCECLFVFCSH